MLHLVFLASMLCYHQFNTSCVTLEEERLYAICACIIIFFPSLLLSSYVKGKVRPGHFGGVACDLHQFIQKLAGIFFSSWQEERGDLGPPSGELLRKTANI